MNFRRGYRRPFQRRRVGSFRFRSRGPLGRSKGPITRVQRAQFWIQSGILMVVGSAGTSTNVAFEMCKIADHVADLNTDSGRVFNSMVKSIDITSIHFDYGIDYDDTNIDYVQDAYANSGLYAHFALCVDRLDRSSVATSSPGPIAMANVPWFSVQTPIAAVSAGVPGILQQEQNWPQRVLWERFYSMNYGLEHVNNTPEGALVQTNPRVRQQSGGFYQRAIRTRLNDFEGLYLTASVTPKENGNVAHTFKAWFAGALYYNVNV